MARKYQAIRRVLFKHAKKVAQINAKLDLIACQIIRLIEIDETFKGRKAIFLLVVDASTGYILFMQWIPQRTKETILAALMPLEALFRNVKIVLTDGAPYFPDVIHELCPQAVHQLCLIHIMRNLFKFLQPFEQQYRQGRRQIAKARESFNLKQETHDFRADKLKKLHQQVRYWESQRSTLQQQYGVQSSVKGILQQYPKLKHANTKLNEIRTKARSMTKTHQRSKKTLQDLQKEIENAGDREHWFWWRYMDQLQVFHRFYDLFLLSKKQYPGARIHLLDLLQKRGSEPLAKELIRILTQVTDVDTIYTKGCPVQLTRNNVNTNVIESINSRLRPYLDRLKKLQGTPYCQAILDLVRLKLNCSHPYSGHRKNTAPIERYGYNLRSRTWLDLIFNGLPPGPQSKLFLPKLSIENQCQAILSEPVT